MRVAFACAWQPQEERTWSRTPSALRAALAERVEIVDVNPRPPTPLVATLKLLYIRRAPSGAWRSEWKWSVPAERLTQASYLRQVADASPDVVVQIGDYGDPGIPFFLYQDMSFGALERRYDDIARYLWIPRQTVQRRRILQDELYGKATGVFAMSEWLARDLVEHGQVSPDKVHAVGGGIHVPAVDGERPPSRRQERLLFVGRDFQRKGGDVVVEAFKRLRHAHPQMTLTIAGPQAWPLPGDVPEGVRFVGDAPLATVSEFYSSHDLFVMPSRFEPFGLVFLEALAHGLPCIGRDDFAMPEIIQPGSNGALVSSDDPDELAAAVASVISNDDIYERCASRAANVRVSHSWEAVVDRMLPILSKAAGR